MEQIWVLSKHQIIPLQLMHENSTNAIYKAKTYKLR